MTADKMPGWTQEVQKVRRGNAHTGFTYREKNYRASAGCGIMPSSSREGGCAIGNL